MFNQLIVHVQNAHYQRQLNDVSTQEVSAHSTRSACRSSPTVLGQHAGQRPLYLVSKQVSIQEEDAAWTTAVSPAAAASLAQHPRFCRITALEITPVVEVE